MEEVGWIKCPGCSFLRENLLELPCCSSTFCEACLQKSARCLKCQNIFNIKHCNRYYQMSSVISANLLECPNPGCGRKLDPILLSHHKQNCPFTPSCEIEQLDTHFETKEQFARRSLFNMQKSYSNMFSKQLSSDPRFYSHIIVPSDTLQGLALKYGVTTQEIKLENKLTTGSNIHERAILRIPVNTKVQANNEIDSKELEALMQRRLVSKFKKETKIREDSEAYYYLHSNYFDLDASISAYRDDILWASLHPSPGINKGTKGREASQSRKHLVDSPKSQASSINNGGACKLQEAKAMHVTSSVISSSCCMPCLFGF